MRFRRRIAGWLAPPDDWASLPPLPAPPDARREQPRPSGWRAWLAVVRAGRRPDARAVVDFTADWLDGNLHERVEAYVPARGMIVDLTPGRGMFARLLLLRSPHRRVVALTPTGLPDVPDDCTGERLQVELRTPERGPIPRGDAILLLETAALPNPAGRRALLARCREAMAPGGRLLLLARRTRPRWRFALGLTLDAARGRLRRALSGERGRSSAEVWQRELERAGFRVQSVDLGERGITPRVLLVAHRPAAAPSSGPDPLPPRGARP